MTLNPKALLALLPFWARATIYGVLFAAGALLIFLQLLDVNSLVGIDLSKWNAAVAYLATLLGAGTALSNLTPDGGPKSITGNSTPTEGEEHDHLPEGDGEPHEFEGHDYSED